MPWKTRVGLALLGALAFLAILDLCAAAAAAEVQPQDAKQPQDANEANIYDHGYHPRKEYDAPYKEGPHGYDDEGEPRHYGEMRHDYYGGHRHKGPRKVIVHCPPPPPPPTSFLLRDDVYEQTTPTTSVDAPGVLDNDIISSCTGPGGVTLAVSTDPLFGKVVLDNNGSFVYTPGNPDKLQADRFQYEATCSPSGDTSTAWVYLPVPTPVPFVARDDAYVQSTPTTVVNSSGVLDNDQVLATCTDGTRLTVVTQPKNGQVNLDIRDGSFTYTPNDASNLVWDAFQYQVACLRNPDVYDGQISTAWVVLSPTTGNCVNASGVHEIEANKLWSLQAAPLLVRTWLGQGGPNLIANGDFSYDSFGNDQNSPSAQWFASQFTTNTDHPILLTGAWTAAKGGSATYAKWGGGVPVERGLLGCPADNCSLSMMYMGDGYAKPGTYYTTPDNSNITSDMFNTEGFMQNAGLVLVPSEFPPGTSYGGPDTPFTLFQTIDTIPGTIYELQWWSSAEFSATADTAPLTGIAAVDISGFRRTYFTVLPNTAVRRTVRFVAQQAQTTIAFLNWGHINIFGPPDTPNPPGIKMRPQSSHLMTLSSTSASSCPGAPPRRSRLWGFHCYITGSELTSNLGSSMEFA